MAKEYWWCEIGPIERSSLPDFCDAPMRNAVQAAFLKLTGQHAVACSSGWGLQEEEKYDLGSVRMEHFNKRRKNN